MIGLYALLVALIISGTYFLIAALSVRDYLLTVAGIAMVSTGVFILVSAVGA